MAVSWKTPLLIKFSVPNVRDFILSLPAKEIALPDEVQKSLLSQSCDPKEVVLQLQVKQVSLEKPDGETKALIRCLARKCKDSDRHDVFQHLREITPAGTTGEFLISEVLCCQFSFLIFTYYLGSIPKGSPRLKISFVILFCVQSQIALWALKGMRPCACA